MKFAPTLGSNMTGRLGGTVFSHNTYGPYARIYAVPVNRNTPGQQAQRSAFAAVSQLWRSMSKPQQVAWTVAAPQHTVPNSTGGSLVLTGQALFMRINTLRRRIGLSLLSEAPATDTVPAITIPVVSLDLTGLVGVTFDAGDEWNASDGGILVSASPLLSAGVSFNSYYTNLGSAIFPGNTQQVFTLPYSTVAGGRIVLQYRSTTPDGRLSNLVYQELTAPQQAIVTSAIVTSATTVLFTFSRATPVADFGPSDFVFGTGTSVSLAQGALPNQIEVTGVGEVAGDTWTLIPAGTASAYTPTQTGVTT